MLAARVVHHTTGPFFLIPAIMLVDMYYRIHRMIGFDSTKFKGKKKA
jgi:hypothetical protein